MYQYQDERTGAFTISMAQVWQQLRAATSLDALCALVCADPRANPSPLYHYKYFKWNLRGLDNGRTIEFRQMPASRSAADLADWVSFVGAFARAATAVEPGRLDGVAADGPLDSFHAVFGLGGLGLADRPTETVHLQRFLEPYGLDAEFWKRRAESKAMLDEFIGWA